MHNRKTTDDEFIEELEPVAAPILPVLVLSAAYIMGIAACKKYCS
jgi:hypothetical protein